MALDGTDIHWHDGLFVLQHHLQLLQRSLNAKVATARNIGTAYPWGILGMDLDEESLKEGTIAIRSLRAVMPSGLLVDVPEAAGLEPVRLADALRAAPSGERVLLAVGNWSPTSANITEMATGAEDQSATMARWQAEAIDVRDENDGTDPEKILVRRINAKLVLESEAPAGIEALPLCRIMSDQTGDRFALRLDPAYVPPSLVCGASRDLMSLASELAGRLSTAREEHLAYLSRGGYDADRLMGQQVEWMLRTQAIASSLPRLADSTWMSNCSPFEFYHQLRSLLGLLNPLRPTQDLFEVPEYDHADAMPGLAEISLRIRNLIFDSGLGSYLKESFVEVPSEGDDNRMDVKLTDAHFVNGKRFYLAVDGEAHADTSSLVDLVMDADAFKLLPSSRAGSRIRGMQLQEDRFPPLALPARSGRVYFSISPASNQAAWAAVREERSLSAVWSKGRALKMTMSFITDTTGKTNG